MTTRGASRSLPYIKNLVESSMSQGLNNDIAASKSRRGKKPALVDAGPFFTRRHRQLHHT
jgi:hypothetical protein